MSPFALFPFIPPLILTALLPYIWKRRQTPGARSLLVLFLALIEWGLAYALEVFPGVDLSTKIFCVSVKYIGIAAVPVAWLAFTLEYSGRQKWLTRRNILLLCGIPAITVLLALTNFNGLMRQPVTLVQAGPFLALDFSFGLWFWVHAAYSYVLVLLGTIFIFQMYRRSSGLYRQQAFALLLAAIVPWVSNALFIFGISPIPYLDLTSFAFTITALVWVWALFRFRLLDVAPVARDTVFESMTDVVLVLDPGNRVVDLNPAAQAAIGHTATEAIGQPIDRILANWPDLVERYRDLAEVREEVAIPAQDGTEPRYFDLRITPITDRQSHLIGRLIVLHDITQGRQAEEELARTRANLAAEEELARTRANLDRTNQQLIQILEAGNMLRMDLNLDTVLHEIVASAQRALGYNVVVLKLLDETSNQMTVHSYAGLDQAGQQALVETRYNWSEQQRRLMRAEFQLGRAYFIPHGTVDRRLEVAGPVSDSDLPISDQPDAWHPEDLLYIPIELRDGHIAGTIWLEAPQDGKRPTLESLRPLDIFVNQAANAIENARSFERVTALAEENRQLFERSEKAVQDLSALTRRLTTEGWDQYFTGQRDELVAEDVGTEPIAIADELSGTGEALEDTAPTAAAHAPRLMTVPILLRGEEIGTIDLESSTPELSWDLDHLSIINSVAQRVGLALDNARLFEQTQTALSETGQLYDIGLRINAAGTIDDVLQAAITPSILSGASSAGLWVLDLNDAGQPAEMEFEASWTREGPPPLPIGTRFHAANFPSSKLWLNETGQPNFIGDIAHDQRVDPQMLAAFQRVNIAATAFIPLVIGKRWIGLIIISWQEPHDFTPGEQRLYQSVATQVSIAIENRRLFEQTQQDAERERTINRITGRIRGGRSVDEVLTIATQELRLATQASRSAVDIAPRTVRPAGSDVEPTSGNGERQGVKV